MNLSPMIESFSIPPDRLKRLRWKGQATYRVLSYYFAVRWNWGLGGEYVNNVLKRFAVPPDPRKELNPPTPGMTPRYSLIDLGPRGARYRYRLLFGDAPLMSSRDPGDVLKHLLREINSEAVRRTGDFLMIHAGAVVTPAGDGVVIPGAPGSGKTTLVAGLVRAGFGYLSDEAAAIDPVSRLLYPYPKALTLKDGRAELFPDLAGDDGPPRTRGERHLHPEDIGGKAVAGSWEVRFVVVHRYMEGAATKLTPISRADAVLQLGRHALNLTTYGHRALPLLADVTRRASSHRLVSGSLDEAVRTVAELTELGA